MDGDVAPLADLVDLASRFDAWTYVDDAHAVGVAGRDGAGSVSAAGCAGRVDVTVGTLGKAFGVAGAFVYGSSTLVQYLTNRARSFVFSTAMLPAQAAAAREAVRIVRAEPERRERLYANTERLRASLHAARIPAIGTATKGLAHIIPVHAGTEAEVMRIGAALARDGYLVGAVRPPTVPEGGSRLRITVSSAHTLQQIAGLTASLAAARRE
jgi:8-amino-7-oxononanoate synthase